VRVPRVGVSAADLLTISNGICGFLALAVAGGLWLNPTGERTLTRHQFVICLLLYGIGMACDVLDGSVARRWGSSGLGSALDTICDTITFGLLPAMLLLARLRDHGSWRAPLLVVSCAYVAGTILRLARHSQHESSAREVGARHGRSAERVAYSGLPSPAGGNCVLAVCVLVPPAPVAVLTVAVVAVLLVSDFPYPINSTVGSVFIFALLAMSFIAIAGVIPLDVPAAVALVGLLPIAIYNALRKLSRRV
jgi:CDP-diacylglycerol--serine O-phosphatidyltransferase